MMMMMMMVISESVPSVCGVRVHAGMCAVGGGGECGMV